jgi:hypothetical protein
VSQHLYLDHLKSIVQTLKGLNAIEKATPNEPTSVYMVGPIQLALDGEELPWRFRNDIGDEWCLEVGDAS